MNRDPHPPTDACHRDHCWAHDVDEPIDGRPYYLACGECFHLYRTRWNLWADHLRTAARIYLADLRNPHHWARTVGGPWLTRADAVLHLILLPFTRPSRIRPCPHCIHDL